MKNIKRAIRLIAVHLESRSVKKAISYQLQRDDVMTELEFRRQNALRRHESRTAGRGWSEAAPASWPRFSSLSGAPDSDRARLSKGATRTLRVMRSSDGASATSCRDALTSPICDFLLTPQKHRSSSRLRNPIFHHELNPFSRVTALPRDSFHACHNRTFVGS